MCRPPCSLRPTPSADNVLQTDADGLPATVASLRRDARLPRIVYATITGRIAPASTLRLLRAFPELGSLCVAGAEFPDGLHGLAGLGIWELDLAECEIATLSPLSACRSLERLTVAATAITGVDLHLPWLKVLDLTGCELLSDLSGLRNLPSLEMLFLDEIYELPDAQVREHVPVARRLTDLSISSCKLLTVETMVGVIRRLPHLMRLHCAECFPDGGVAEIRRQFPGLFAAA